jgi:hypothetical protein
MNQQIQIALTNLIEKIDIFFEQYKAVYLSTVVKWIRLPPYRIIEKKKDLFTLISHYLQSVSKLKHYLYCPDCMLMAGLYSDAVESGLEEVLCPHSLPEHNIAIILANQKHIFWFIKIDEEI